MSGEGEKREGEYVGRERERERCERAREKQTEG